jgi:hypothetical protein
MIIALLKLDTTGPLVVLYYMHTFRLSFRLNCTHQVDTVKPE